MTHLHSHHRSHAVQQRTPAFPPWVHLLNAPVSPLDFGSAALIPTHPTEQGATSPLMVDGEIITSIDTLPTHSRYDTDATPAWEPKRTLLRRAIDDPYWILMTLTAALGLAITATVVYGAIQIILTIDAWLHTNAATIGTITGVTALIILVIVCGGAKAAQCAGLHCGGCKR